MTLPTFFTMVRHGHSEANVAQSIVKSGGMIDFPAGFDTRHDAYTRLTPRGVEQAEAAGEWLRTQPDFDRFYVSPHIRTRETAAHLHLDADWRVDDRFRERDWGEMFSHKQMDEEVKKLKEMGPWYWHPRGGESMATGLRLRVESVHNSLHRRGGRNENVLSVTHGEFIRAAQFVLERLTPEAWQEMDKDEAFKMQNTMIVQYTTVNPEDSEERRSHYAWRRAICPWDRSLDWDGGEWVRVGAPKSSNADLMAVVNSYPRLFPDSYWEAQEQD